MRPLTVLWRPLAGWLKVSQRGSHEKWRSPDGRRTAIVFGAGYHAAWRPRGLRGPAYFSSGIPALSQNTVGAVPSALEN